MLNKRAKYGDDWGVPSAEHPAGECLNRSAPGVEDGSYFEKSWVNDLMALSGALMNSAGYTPNGTEDTATACQVFDALVNNRWSEIGNYSVGSIVVGSDGNQYKAVSINGRDSSVVNPETKTDRTVWVGYPYESGSNANGRYKIYHDGSVEQWGASPATDSNGFTTITLPIPMPSASYDIVLSDRTQSSSSSVSISVFGVVIDTITSSTFQSRGVRVDETLAINDSVNFYVSGV